MKRRLIVVFVALLALLASCAKPASAPVGFEFMHTYVEEDRLKVIQGLIDAFQAENPGFEVKQVPVSEDAFWTRITTLMQGRQLPALIDVSVDQARLLAASDVVDVDTCTSVVQDVGVDRFYAGAVAVLRGDSGKLFGVPLTGWVQGIWYRKDLFAEKGLAAPEKWDDILTAAKAFHSPADKKYGIVFATEATDFTEQTFSQFALSNGAELFDASGKPAFNSPAMRRAVEFYRELYKYSLPGSNGFTQVKDSFSGGNAAMVVYSTYILGGLYEQGMADKVGFAVPEGVAPASFGMVSTEVITNTVPEAQRQAAAAFMKFLLRNENYIPWMHMAPGGPNPVLKGVASDPAYLGHPLLKAYGDTAKAIPEAFADLAMFGFQDGKTNPKMGEISARMIIPTALNNILVLGADLDGELAKAQKAMEDVVAGR
ncbi:MAG: sugar ABC transporter substrate-binding protein [Spirochaetales bacterium]|nr:sugar ABC transporter substrate-binding protein [Spirochaetales bacterium]